MALTKADRAESLFNAPLTRASLAVAGLRLFVLTLLSALLVGCGGGGSGRQQPPPLNPGPPGNEAPVFTSSTTATVNENQTTAYTAVATDPDGDTLTYSLDGTDGSFFSIDERTGVVSFGDAPDYENPGDEDRNNVYEIAVTATDSDGLHASQNVTITVSNVNDGPPVFTSGTTATIDENQTAAVYTAVATDPDGDAPTDRLDGTDAFFDDV